MAWVHRNGLQAFPEMKSYYRKSQDSSNFTTLRATVSPFHEEAFRLEGWWKGAGKGLTQVTYVDLMGN